MWRLPRAAAAALALVLSLVLVACMAEDSCGCQYPDESAAYEIYLLTGWGAGAVLEPYEVRDDSGRDAGLVAVTALLHYAPRADAELVNGWAPFEEPLAEVRSVRHQEGEIVVDIDRDMRDPVPTRSLAVDPDGRLTVDQLVRTVQEALGSADPVRLTVNGDPARGVWDLALVNGLATR